METPGLTDCTRRKPLSYGFNFIRVSYYSMFTDDEPDEVNKKC